MQPPSPSPNQRITELKGAVLRSLDESSWKGVDPFDGLLSPLARPWVDGLFSKSVLAPWVRLALLQGVKRSWFDMRPWLGIRPVENAMSWAVGALAARADGEDPGVARARIQRMLALRDPATGLWGYPFPWQARAFYARACEPNLVISSVCLRALASGASPDGGLATDERTAYRRALNSFFDLFWREREGFFSYVEHETVLVHNANLFGCEAVFVGRAIGVDVSEAEVMRASRALQQTLGGQDRATGRWPYGTLPHHSWSDCFHTAYNLVSLIRIRASWSGNRSGSYEPDLRQELEEAIRRGQDYYLKTAFTDSGSARYYDRETWPIEAHSVAAALIFLREAQLAGFIGREQAADRVCRIIQAAERDLYLGDGRFGYRKWPRFRVKQVFLRWTQAWMYYGLVCAAAVIRDSESNKSA